MKIHVLNLDRDAERFEEFSAVNLQLVPSVVRYPAIDGATVDTDLLVEQKVIDRRILQTYTPGALGYALGHLALWQHAVETGEWITLCDDDAIFNRGILDSASAAISQLDGQWDLILWGWNFDAPMTFELLPGVSTGRIVCDQDSMRAGVPRFVEQTIDFRLFRLMRAFGTPCYSISPKGAAGLRQHCLPLRPMPLYSPVLQRFFPNNGIDMMMNALYPEISAFVSIPPLVVTKNDHDKSTIQTGRTLAELRDATPGGQ